MLLATQLVAEPRLVDADHDDFVHGTAHIGMSATLNTFFLGFYKKMFQMPRGPAMAFAAFTTLTIGLTYKAMESGKPVGWGKSMIQNAIGVGISDLIVFEFDMF